MPPPNLAARQDARRFASILADILDRLRKLERTPKLAHSSIEDGALSVYTDGTLSLSVGTQYDGSTMAASLNGPTPPTPTAPTLVAMPSGIEVRWDGQYVGADGVLDPSLVAPMDFRQVDVVVATTSGADFLTTAPRDSFISARGGALSIVLSGTDPRYVALVTRTESGTPSQPSAVASISPLTAVVAGEMSVTAVGPGPQVFRLPATPITNSEHVYWNGVYLPSSDWSRTARRLTVPDATSQISAGDVLTVEYLASSGVVEPVTYTPPDFLGAVQAHGEAGSTLTLTVPPAAKAGDFLVAVGYSDGYVIADPPGWTLLGTGYGNGKCWYRTIPAGGLSTVGFLDNGVSGFGNAIDVSMAAYSPAAVTEFAMYAYKGDGVGAFAPSVNTQGGRKVALWGEYHSAFGATILAAPLVQRCGSNSSYRWSATAIGDVVVGSGATGNHFETNGGGLGTGFTVVIRDAY